MCVRACESVWVCVCACESVWGCTFVTAYVYMYVWAVAPVVERVHVGGSAVQ